MRDVIAGLVAGLLLLVALSLIATLAAHRRRREAARAAERRHGRTIVAEIPGAADLVLFTEAADCFHYGDRRMEKAAIRAVRVLVNGAPIAAHISRRLGGPPDAPPTSFEDRPEGIARDRWDVAIETTGGVVLVECGAIRERVSQELARRVYDAVKADLERRDG